MFPSQILQGGFTGLSALGAEGGAALRGSIVDAVIEVGDSNRVFFYDQALANSLRDRLNASGFKVLNLDASNLGSFGGGGTIRVRVQILSDGYASAADAASVIRGAAAYLGYNATGYQGVLVSTAQGTAGTGAGGIQSGQSYDPNVNVASTDNPVSRLLQNLTGSPVSLAVVIGAAALLLFMAKK